ncbi:MAG: hypothetical protein Q9195_001320 [Heterodermia aff. obscurata]
MPVDAIFLDVLSSTATRREAKTYLQRYSPQKAVHMQPQKLGQNVGVNLGSLYLPIRSVDESPIFTQNPARTTFSDTKAGPLHVALVKVKSPQIVEDATLDGIGLTLSQLSRLGLNCIVVVDLTGSEVDGALPRPLKAIDQVDRIVEAIDRHGRPGARRLDNALEITSFDPVSAASIKLRGATRVTNRNLLLTAIRRGIIPVIAPIAFKKEIQKLFSVSPDDILLALTQDLAGLYSNTFNDDEPEKVVAKMSSLQTDLSLDRLIILDPLGGIPSTDQAHGAHVFINIEHEYDDIRHDLLGSCAGIHRTRNAKVPRFDPARAFPLSSPLSKLASNELKSAFNPVEETSNEEVVESLKSHVQNLDLLKNILGLLPPTSSAIVTTPREAANFRPITYTPSSVPDVRTRRRRNPLIHNLLTDKPVFSSSLPARPSRSPDSASTSAPSTFAKRGMPVTIIPDPQLYPWKPPAASSPSLNLSDPCVDMARLVYLIEDSFNQKLDVPHYISRISGRIAGIIICGNYEGGAILTWEAPYPDCNPERMVPYLDKFAVLKRSQGAGGVADIVFKAMVGDCFPHGVCWRSRQNNPVNKWYFERSKGTWKMPHTNWTMFWTTDGIEASDERGVFADYAKVCRDVVPSWADQKAGID